MVNAVMNVSDKRLCAAPRETVFRAFTEKGLIEKWFGPSEEVSVTVEALDLKVGGAYRYWFHMPDGTEKVLEGRYKEISPPEKLVYSWTWTDNDQFVGAETQVTVEFRQQGDQTEVHLLHELFPDGEMCEYHTAGWNGALDRLEKTCPRLD